MIPSEDKAAIAGISVIGCFILAVVLLAWGIRSHNQYHEARMTCIKAGANWSFQTCRFPNPGDDD